MDGDTYLFGTRFDFYWRQKIVISTRWKASEKVVINSAGNGKSWVFTYLNFFKRLILIEESNFPYVGCDINGFKGITNQIWGYIKVLMKFRDKDTQNIVKCLGGKLYINLQLHQQHTTLIKLCFVSSKIHLNWSCSTIKFPQQGELWINQKMFLGFTKKIWNSWPKSRCLEMRTILRRMIP